MSIHKRTISEKRLRNLIAALARDGTPTIDRAARSLGLSIRSLQRGLHREGITYSDLVDSSRREIAESLLRDTGLNVGEIAALLGYRDPSSFSRAFARWDGCSPRQYRQRLLAPAAREPHRRRDGRT